MHTIKYRTHVYTIILFITILRVLYRYTMIQIIWNNARDFKMNINYFPGLLCNVWQIARNLIF